MYRLLYPEARRALTEQERKPDGEPEVGIAVYLSQLEHVGKGPARSSGPEAGAPWTEAGLPPPWARGLSRPDVNVGDAGP